jgi:hypothetical protein
MRTHRILLIAAVLLSIPALASAAPPVSQASGAPAAVQAAAPTLDAFLVSLSGAPGGAPATRLSGCGANFCTQAQRDACTQQCLSHPHHGPFVGLECCSNCTTLCICGSVPVNC